MAIVYKSYPLNRKIDKNLLDVIAIFEKNESLISSDSFQLNSDDV